MKLFEYSCFTPDPRSFSENNVSFSWCPIFGTKPQPSQRSYHAVCVHNNKIYMYGGRAFKGTLSEFWVYNCENTSWEQIFCKDGPPPLEGHTMEVYKNDIYVFGGETSFASAGELPLWQFNVTECKWSKVQQEGAVMVPSGRRHHTAVLYNDTMCVYGGYQDLIGPTKDLWCFDFETQSWHYDVGASCESAPDARYGHCAAVAGHSMWVCGGLTGLKPNSDVNIWNFELRIWIPIKTKGGPSEFSNHAMSLINDHLYVFGGRTSSSGEASHNMWCLSVHDRIWKKCYCSGGIKPPPTSGHCLIPLSTPSHAKSRRVTSSSMPNIKRKEKDDSKRMHSARKHHSISCSALPNDSRLNEPNNDLAGKKVIVSDKSKLLYRTSGEESEYAYDNPLITELEDKHCIPLQAWQQSSSFSSSPTITPTISSSSDATLKQPNNHKTTKKLPAYSTAMSSFSYNLLQDSLVSSTPHYDETSFIQLPNSTSDRNNVAKREAVPALYRGLENNASSNLTQITVRSQQKTLQRFDSDSKEDVSGMDEQKEEKKFASDFGMDIEEIIEERKTIPDFIVPGENTETESTLLLIIGGRVTSPLSGNALCMWQCEKL